MKYFFLYFNTLKHLKFKQFFYKIYYALVQKKPSKLKLNKIPQITLSNKWTIFNLNNRRISADYIANFLNYKKKLNLPCDWNDQSDSKLWTYNLHYFEDFTSIALHENKEFYSNYLDLWIKQNPACIGIGWEPYPTSLRISNILKAGLSGFHLKDNHIKSLYIQSKFLFKNLEKHLLCNHYFVNLKALLFSAIIFNKTEWLVFVSDEILKELDEQILSDGEHFELSPMYHALILVDLLDIYNLCLSYSMNELNELEKKINCLIPKMLRFLDLMTHGDGGLSFFNDSVDGISPSTKKINEYASLLGFITNDKNLNKVELNNLASGYIVAINDQNKLIFDSAKIGPNYNPGHAHADTLSFELSIRKERVFVNSGISHYENDSARLKQRGTMLHNTVQINNNNSTEVWSSFRVAKRADINFRSCKLNDEIAYICGEHNGYKKFLRGTNHNRKLIFKQNELTIKDYLDGVFQDATARFYFHPYLKVFIKDNTINIEGQKFKLLGNLSNHKYRLIESYFYPEFGKAIGNSCLEIDFISNKNNISFQWEYK